MQCIHVLSLSGVVCVRHVEITSSCSIPCVHYCDSLVLSKGVYCVELVSTELSHHYRHVVGGWGLA